MAVGDDRHLGAEGGSLVQVGEAHTETQNRVHELLGGSALGSVGGAKAAGWVDGEVGSGANNRGSTHPGGSTVLSGLKGPGLPTLVLTIPGLGGRVRGSAVPHREDTVESSPHTRGYERSAANTSI